MLRQRGLQSTLGQELIMNMSRRLGMVAQALILVRADIIRREQVDDGIALRSRTVQPLAHVVQHEILDLGYVLVSYGPSTGLLVASSQLGLRKSGWKRHSKIGSVI